MVDNGLRATEDSLADLLVGDLAGGSSAPSKRICTSFTTQSGRIQFCVKPGVLQWADRTQALRGRCDQAPMDVAKLLQPKVTRVDLPRRTLTDEADLDAWLQKAEQRVCDKLKDGPVMI